jgi:tetratricopeptide (TPR) repeat protein
LPVELTMINALPTHVNPHLMQAVDDANPPYRLYFLDENTDLKSGEFWVFGERTADMVISTSPRQTHLVVTLTNGPVPNQVDVSVAKTTQTIRFKAPGEQRRLVFPLTWSMPYFQSSLYPVKIRSHTGFVPKFLPQTRMTDLRYLGCRVHFSLNPLEIGQVYLAIENPQAALPILEQVVKNQPHDIHSRYYLGLAYQQAGKPEAAISELAYCQTLLPEFQTAFPHTIYEAEDLQQQTGTIIAQADASNGKVVVSQPGTDSAGFLVYGPYVEFKPGQYQARYRMKVGKPGDTPVVQNKTALFFDVYNSKQELCLQRDSLLVEEAEYDSGEGYRDYTVNFDLVSPTTLEFRVETTGTVPVAVDRIEVYPRQPVQIYQTLAHAKSSLGMVQQAYQFLQQATAIDPWTPALQIDVLQALLRLQQWENAVQFAKRTGRFALTHTGLVTYLDPQLTSLPFDVPDVVAQFYKDVYTHFAPEYALVHQFGDQLASIGYDLGTEKLVPGGQFTIRYYWKALKSMHEDYAIFVHFAKKGKLLTPEIVAKFKRKLDRPITDLFQQDHQPVDSVYPTHTWLAQELIREQYTVTVPPEIEPGTYEIWIGVWNPFTQTRLQSDGKTKVKIGELVID